MEKYKGIASDSREVKKDFIFVAVKGIRNDGHDHIEEAVKNGATLVIGEKDIQVPKGTEYIKVADSREALGKYASDFYGNPSGKLKIIGVTGTKGKTTTCDLIYHLLTALGEKAGMVSSIAAKIGDREIDTGFHVTNPDVISLNKFLSEMVEAGCKYAVLEVSSHGIDQKRIAGINFEIGVLTNIAPEHLDYHKTFEEYKRVKMSFINSCKIKIIAPSKTDLNLLPGEFNNLNLEAALNVIESLGLDKDKALNAAKNYKLPEGRLEEVQNKKGIKIVIDFAHTPGSLEAALKYLNTLPHKKIISVFGCAGERDPYKRPEMGRISAELADITILTAEDPRSEDVNNIIKQIKSGVKNDKAVVFEEPDRGNAIKKALEIAREGDIVGFFGKGHEKSMNLDGVHEIPWSDREVVEKYIK